MHPYRSRVHRLIDRLPDPEVEKVWVVLRQFYYDSYMLKAIETAKEAFRPGDTLSREEALRFLALM